MAQTKVAARRVGLIACSLTALTLRPMPTATMAPSLRLRSSQVATRPASNARHLSGLAWSTDSSARLMPKWSISSRSRLTVRVGWCLTRISTMPRSCARLIMRPTVARLMPRRRDNSSWVCPSMKEGGARRVTSSVDMPGAALRERVASVVIYAAWRGHTGRAGPGGGRAGGSAAVSGLPQPLLMRCQRVELGLRARPGNILRGQEGLHDALGQFDADHARADGDDVRVVAERGALGAVGVVRLRGADARHLVRCNRHADAGAAQQQAALGLAARDGLRHRDADVRVQHRLVVMGAEVRHLVALGQQGGLQAVFHGVGGLVAADGDFHGGFHCTV